MNRIVKADHPDRPSHLRFTRVTFPIFYELYGTSSPVSESGPEINLHHKVFVSRVHWCLHPNTGLHLQQGNVHLWFAANTRLCMYHVNRWRLQEIRKVKGQSVRGMSHKKRFEFSLKCVFSWFNVTAVSCTCSRGPSNVPSGPNNQCWLELIVVYESDLPGCSLVVFFFLWWS